MDSLYPSQTQDVAGGVVGSESGAVGSELDAIHQPAQPTDASVDGPSSTSSSFPAPSHADVLPPSHPEPLSISQLVASPAPVPVVHSPSPVGVPPAVQVEEHAHDQQAHEPMDTSDSPSSTSLQPPYQQPPQPSFSPSPVPQPPSVSPAPVAEADGASSAQYEAAPPQLAADQEALVASMEVQPPQPAQYDFAPAPPAEEVAAPPAPAPESSLPPPVQAERELISSQPQHEYEGAPPASAAAPSTNGFSHHQDQHSMPTPPPTVHEQDHQASSSHPVPAVAQEDSSAFAAPPAAYQPVDSAPAQAEQQQLYAPAAPQQNGSPLPPPPADLPGSHPLAPPGAPFSDAFPTPAQTQFDPPAPAAPAPYVPASTSGGLKREYSEGIEEPAQQQQPLNGTAALYGFQTHEPVSKRAKVEGPPSAPLSVAQQKFFLSTVRSLKKMREAFAFSAPVDPIALGIPHYFQIITHPMDLTTLEYKLAASGPKPKGRADKGKYADKDEVVLDFDRVWNNSVRFNGPDHLVSLAGLELEKAFDKAMRSCPKDEVFRPPPPPAPAQQAYPPNPYGQPQAASHAVNPPAPVRRASVSNGSAPAPRRNSEVDGRPKREIHPPVSKDLGWSEGGPSSGSTRRKSGGGQKRKNGGDEQMRYLKKELTDLVTKKQYYELAFPFMYPVDPIALNIPDYPKIVKRPMDLSTIRGNLNDNYYDDPQEVHADMKLMFKNCYLFNPPGTPVATAGKQLQDIWDAKWRALPVKEPTPVPESESEEEVIDSDEETFSMVRQQMLALSQKLEEMQNKKSGKKSKLSSSSHKKSSSSHHASGEPRPKGSNTHPKTAKVPKPVQPANPSAPSSAYAPPQQQPKPKKPSHSAGGGSGGGSASGQKPKQPKKMKKGPVDDDFSDDDRATSVTMAQKQELADKIQMADGDVLNQAITIIQESMPLGDSAEEIELDIESLPPATVLKLYNLVVRGPKKPRGSRKAGTGGNKGGTGGLNRKSMNEDEEAEKIRKLEEKLGSFDQQHQPQQHQQQHAQPSAQGGGDDSDGSESGSDSASDSE